MDIDDQTILATNVAGSLPGRISSLISLSISASAQGRSLKLIPITQLGIVASASREISWTRSDGLEVDLFDPS